MMTIDIPLDKDIKVIVKPRCKENEFLGWDEKRLAYRICLKAVPEKGKANLELIKFLERKLKKKVHILKGKTSKTKILRIA